MSAFGGTSLLQKAILVVPLSFAIGLSVKDYFVSLKEEDALVEKKVQQRLGVWVPPALSAAERAALELERKGLLSDIAAIEAKMAKARGTEDGAMR